MTATAARAQFGPWRLLVLLTALTASLPSWSWGGQGHRLVALIAEAELTPKARAAVDKILLGQSLAAASTWMDEVRPTPEGRAMQRWHFVGSKVCGAPRPSCKHGNCATGRIEWARELLRTGTQAESLQALRVLTHLVGDVHQPLHAADNSDYGGNGVFIANRSCVEFGNSQPTACKLHTYWDTSLVTAAIGDQSDPEAAATWAAALGALPAADSDRADDWADESARLAKSMAYAFDGFACRTRRSSMMATEAYDAQGVATVKKQIATAGKRLARLLNGIFN